MKRDRNHFKGHLAALLACIVWGLTFVHTRVLIGIFSATSIIFMRYFIASTLLFSLIIVKGLYRRPKARDVLMMLITGGLGMFGYNILLTYSLYTITPSLSSVFNGIIPLFTVLVDYLFMRRKPLPLRLLIAGLCSFLGIFLVAQGDGLSLAGNAWIGISLMMLATCFWIVYTFKSEALFRDYHQLEVLAFQTLSACLITLPFVVREGVELSYFSDPSILVHVLSLGLLCSMGAFVLFAKGLMIIGQSKASLYLNIVPITSVIGAFLVLGDPITLAKVSGIVVVITALRFGVSDESKESLIKKSA